MARVFAYHMENDLKTIEDQAIFLDTSSKIKDALQASYDVNNSKTHIAKTAFEIALKQLQTDAYNLGKSLEDKEPSKDTQIIEEPIDYINIINEFRKTLK